MKKKNNPLIFKSDLYAQIDQEISKVFVGQKHILTEVLITLFSNGHVLLNGLPGLAKTLMVKAFSKLFSLTYNRTQFTPDLMPSDLIGYEILEEKGKTRQMRFIPGPIFCNLFLADEINRSPAKTQSALLEAMEEKQVTVMGVQHKLQPPFIVLATQNPINEKGTYELPEAQLDRFMSMLEISYPTHEEELEIAKIVPEEKIPLIKPLFKNEKEYFKIRQDIEATKISQEALNWIVKLVRGTRPENEEISSLVKPYIQVGCSPRATKSIIQAAKTCAFFDKNKYVEKNHIEFVTPMILRHRIKLKYEAEFDNINANQLINSILENTKS